MRRTLLRYHRWISLTFCAFWLIQALTGIAASFYRELDDFSVAGRAVPTSVTALGERLDRLSVDFPGTSVSSIWASGGFADRYELFVKDDATGEVEKWRLDGQGQILRRPGPDGPAALPATLGFLVTVHHNLLGGEMGRYFVVASAILLLSNIGFGVLIAWPKRGHLARAMRLPRGGPLKARLYQMHRALGLWVAVPALVVTACGAGLALQPEIEAALGSARPSAKYEPAPCEDERCVAPSVALANAVALYPGARLSAMQLPRAGKPWYRVLVRQSGEPRPVYGATEILVDPRDGSISGQYDAFDRPWRERVGDYLFVLHTGKSTGVAGRLAVFAVALWLVSMLVLGGWLWMARRRK